MGSLWPQRSSDDTVVGTMINNAHQSELERELRVSAVEMRIKRARRSKVTRSFGDTRASAFLSQPMGRDYYCDIPYGADGSWVLPTFLERTSSTAATLSRLRHDASADVVASASSQTQTRSGGQVERATLDVIARSYAFRTDDTRRKAVCFVEQYPVLVNVLIKAGSPLQRFFPGSSYYLDVRRDPDIHEERLTLEIETDLDAWEAVDRLIHLQEEWGIGANDQVGDRLTIILTSP